MWKTKSQTIEGYNQQVGVIKENAKDQDIKVSLVTFSYSTDIVEHFWNEPAESLQFASDKDYKPEGGTAFYDALGFTLDKLSEINDPDAAFLVIAISDGEENDSKSYLPADLRQKIESKKDDKRWTITYMGCSPEYVETVAATTGINVSNMAAWSNKSAGAATMGLCAANSKMDGYLKKRARGVYDADKYYSESAVACADFRPDEEKKGLKTSLPNSNDPASYSLDWNKVGLNINSTAPQSLCGLNINTDAQAIVNMEQWTVKDSPFRAGNKVNLPPRG
jgi:hypothetical protein